MMIIGVDFHPEFEQIASVDTETGEFHEKRLAHPGEAEKFYRALAVVGQEVRIDMEASGHARWFERLLGELQFEMCIGDAAEIQSKRARSRRRIGKMRSILGAELGESRPAATVVAPTPHGADADSNHEPTAGRGSQ